MTMASDSELIAAFLAKGGAVTQAAPARAYGINPDADDVRRAPCASRARYVLRQRGPDAFRMGDRDGRLFSARGV
jgi:hypothetical protein